MRPYVTSPRRSSGICDLLTKKMVSVVVAKRTISLQKDLVQILVLGVFHEVAVLEEVTCLIIQDCVGQITQEWHWILP